MGGELLDQLVHPAPHRAHHEAYHEHGRDRHEPPLGGTRWLLVQHQPAVGDRDDRHLGERSTPPEHEERDERHADVEERVHACRLVARVDARGREQAHTRQRGEEERSRGARPGHQQSAADGQGGPEHRVDVRVLLPGG